MGKLNYTRIRQKIAGFGVLEVLIGSLVIAIGLLGLVLLQSTSMRAIQQAYYTNVAVSIAQDTIARLQANPFMTSNGYQAGGNNNYLQLFVTDAIDSSYSGNTLNWYNAWYAAQTSPCYTGANYCTPYDIANTDKADLAIHAWTQLPGGRIKICFDSTNPNSFTCDNTVASARSIAGSVGLSVFTIKIRWNDVASTGYKYYQTKFIYSCTNASGC